MNLVPYSSWSTRKRGATAASHPIGATLGVTLHWEGPKMGTFPHTSCDDKVRGIQAFHRDSQDWADIAYNAVVCPHGYVFEGRGPGVKSAANGDTDVNDDWYAVCYLGGKGDPLTDAGKKGFKDAVAWLRAKGNAGTRVNGHRDHVDTECPGDTIYHWLRSTTWGGSTTTTGGLTMSDVDDILAQMRNHHEYRQAAEAKMIALLTSINTKLDRLDPDRDGKVTVEEPTS